MAWNCQLWSLRIRSVYTAHHMGFPESLHPCQHRQDFSPDCFPRNHRCADFLWLVWVCMSSHNPSSHLSNELYCSLAASPILPTNDGGSRLGSTMTSSGLLTRLRRISFTFLPFESAGWEGLTSDDSVDKASETASGPWVTPEDDRSASLAAVEVWSSPMPESYRRRDTPFSTSSPPEMAPLSKETQ